MRGIQAVLSIAGFWMLASTCWAGPPNMSGAPPRIKALLEQAWAAESGTGTDHEPGAAARLYCEAARFGHAEAHERVALIHLNSHGELRNLPYAKFFLMTASEHGSETAAQHLRHLSSIPLHMPACLSGDFTYLKSFNFKAYVGKLGQDKRQVAHLVQRIAADYGVDERLALAVAGVESNFEPRATSPKNAQGVMQLIPATARRFGVTDPYNAEDNIRGGLKYLKWLMERYSGNQRHALAAYNAGEGAVDRYKGVPPYPETQNYVRRVIDFASVR
ncbi:MAG: hypothetical protein RLZZ271_165 [Pseudomonadota bacterium]|jgi:hypothetical protein